MSALRIGHGYDLHAVTQGEHVVLGGVRIAAPFGLHAHSDGDVLLHALCDALLGAAGLGDIGRHFPDSDPAWRGAAGTDLLQRTTQSVAAQGWAPVNGDATLLAQRPRIGPHVEAMRVQSGVCLGLEPGAVNIKATTHEGVDSIGRGEALAAHAVVLLEAR